MPKQTHPTNGARMIGKKGAPSRVVSNVLLTITQPAASSIRKIADISKLPRNSPKPRSSHHSLSTHSPNCEGERLSRRRAETHRLNSATNTSATWTATKREVGDVG